MPRVQRERIEMLVAEAERSTLPEAPTSAPAIKDLRRRVRRGGAEVLEDPPPMRVG